MTPDDIIDVTVTLTSAPDMYTAPDLQPCDLPPEPPLWAHREHRYVWRREVFDLLDQWQGRAPATTATLAEVKHGLDWRLYRMGVGDVFTAVTSLTPDDCGMPRMLQVGLALTDEEIKNFGEQPLDT